MNAKILGFLIIYLLLDNLCDCTFNMKTTFFLMTRNNRN